MNISNGLSVYIYCLLLICSFYVINTETYAVEQCTQDSDCGVKQYCAYKDQPELANYCKQAECTQNSHCPSGKCITQKSGKDYYKCVKCTNDSHCSGTQGKCKINNNNELYNDCVECLYGNDCGPGNHCVDHRCYVCAQDSHCSGDKRACLLNRSNPDGMCVECTSNIHCNADQICDTLTNSCKMTVKQPESQISPDKYPSDNYKGKSQKKLQTAPEIQKKQIDPDKDNTKKGSTKNKK